jgi:hypothetical protein
VAALAVMLSGGTAVTGAIDATVVKVSPPRRTTLYQA